MPQAPARRDTSESSDVAKLVRLHHRRRGWAWVATGSVIGLVVYAGIDVNLSGNLTGTAETLSVIPVFVLFALVVAGLVVVIVDTSRIHRADAGRPRQAHCPPAESHAPGGRRQFGPPAVPRGGRPVAAATARAGPAAPGMLRHGASAGDVVGAVTYITGSLRSILTAMVAYW